MATPFDEVEEETSTSFQRTLFSGTCMAHRLPVRTSAAPFNAEYFNDPIPDVTILVLTWSFTKAVVELRRGNQRFAICPLDGDSYSESVERTTGSSRYFALKVTNDKGSVAYLGVSFKERSDAFDFISALQEWNSKKQRSSTDTVVSLISPSDREAVKDFSLTSKITLSLPTIGAVKKTVVDEGVDTGKSILAPPPSSSAPKSTMKRGQRKDL